MDAVAGRCVTSYATSPREELGCEVSNPIPLIQSQVTSPVSRQPIGRGRTWESRVSNLDKSPAPKAGIAAMNCPTRDRTLVLEGSSSHAWRAPYSPQNGGVNHQYRDVQLSPLRTARDR